MPAFSMGQKVEGPKADVNPGPAYNLQPAWGRTGITMAPRMPSPGIELGPGMPQVLFLSLFFFF